MEAVVSAQRLNKETFETPEDQVNGNIETLMVILRFYQRIRAL